MVQLIYPCLCAEIPITYEDIDRWGKVLLGVKDGWEGSMVTLIMSLKYQTRAIDDPQERFTIDEINFDGEMIA
jgi:hypothetical protein